MRNFLYLVAVAVVAGLIVSGLKHCMFQSGKQLTPEAEPKRTIRPRDETPEQTPPKTQAQVEDSPAGSEAVRKLLPLALRIYGSSERNTALEKLVDAALVVPDLPLAVEIAQSVYGSTTRNALYVRIIDKAISRSDFETAEAVAGKIYGSTPRNSQIQKIIRARIERRQN